MSHAEYKDDPSIPDDAELWRWISSVQIIFDPKQNRRRPISGAFKDSGEDETPMSVLVASIVIASGRSARSIVDALIAQGRPGTGLAAFTAGLVRANGLGVCLHPVANEPAHAYVIGKKTAKAERALAYGCTWAVEPA